MNSICPMNFFRTTDTTDTTDTTIWKPGLINKFQKHEGLIIKFQDLTLVLLEYSDKQVN